MSEVEKMSDNANDPSGWHRSIIEQLHDAEEVVEAVPVGLKNKLDNPDYVAVKLAHGNTSDVLDNILGRNEYVILKAAVGDSGELMLNIRDPRHPSNFFNNLL